MTEYLICPFCKEDGFDLVGLKTHLWCNHCDIFNKTEVDTNTMADLLHLKREGTMKVNVEIAKICNQANRHYCIDNQLVAPAKWDDLPSGIQESIVSGVAEVIADPKVTPAEMHQKWVDYKKAGGWKYGKVKDVNKKLHPSLVPFEKLPKVEQAKDFIFIETVKNEID